MPFYLHERGGRPSRIHLTMDSHIVDGTALDKMSDSSKKYSDRTILEYLKSVSRAILKQSSRGI
jgi:hypothetical protein